MTTEHIKLSFLLDLFNSGHDNMYMSHIELTTNDNQSVNRIEVILPNVGRLCLYQRFIENADGEQLPDFCVFYTYATSPNVRTKIKNHEILSKAVRVIYDCKKYCEQHPESKIGRINNFIINTIIRNQKLAQKLYTKQINEHRHNLILSNMNQK